MKHITLFALLLCSTLFSKAQSFEYTVENGNSELIDELKLKDKYRDYKIHGFIKNTSDISQKYIWELVVVDKPNDWIFTVCDPVVCVPKVLSSSFELKPGQKGTFDMGTIAQGFIGKAEYKVSIYPEKKKEMAQTITYKYTINEALATETELLDKLITVGPNPFTNSINIVNASDVQLQKVQIVNLQGIVVLEEEITASQSTYTMSLESLQEGTYCATFTSANGSTSKMITKQ